MFDEIGRKKPKKGEGKKGPSWCVLVIEDNTTDRRVIESALTKHGFRVLVAENGEAGIATAKLQKPDLILLDYQLPGIKGSEVCQAIKTEESIKDIPIILLTGENSPSTVLESYEYGADQYLAKPISPNHLIDQIQKTLGKE